MQCTKCDSALQDTTTTYKAPSLLLGYILISDVPCQKCSNPECDCVYFDTAATKRIEHLVNTKEQAMVGLLPVGEFLSRRQASSLLNMQPKAFSKNQKIKNGFIISMQVSGRRLYYRPSVMAFAGPGKDGRINLAEHYKTLNIASVLV